MGIRCANHANSQRLALTSPIIGCRSVGIVRLRTTATDCSFSFGYIPSGSVTWQTDQIRRNVLGNPYIIEVFTIHFIYIQLGSSVTYDSQLIRCRWSSQRDACEALICVHSSMTYFCRLVLKNVKIMKVTLACGFWSGYSPRLPYSIRNFTLYKFWSRFLSVRVEFMVDITELYQADLKLSISFCDLFILSNIWFSFLLLSEVCKISSV
jgi:hypothetical protein